MIPSYGRLPLVIKSMAYRASIQKSKYCYSSIKMAAPFKYLFFLQKINYWLPEPKTPLYVYQYMKKEQDKISNKKQNNWRVSCSMMDAADNKETCFVHDSILKERKTNIQSKHDFKQKNQGLYLLIFTILWYYTYNYYSEQQR